jgi:hypothetical protein
LADGQDEFTAAESQGFDALHAGIDRFDETSLLKRDALWDADGAVLNDPIHDSHVFGETPAGGLESGCTADFLVRGALGECLVLAVETLAARDVVEDHDPVAGAVILHSFTHGSHHA